MSFRDSKKIVPTMFSFFPQIDVSPLFFFFMREIYIFLHSFQFVRQPTHFFFSYVVWVVVFCCDMLLFFYVIYIYIYSSSLYTYMVVWDGDFVMVLLWYVCFA